MKTGEWIKANLIGIMSFSFVIFTFVGSQIVSYTTLKTQVSGVQKELDERKKHIDEQKFIDRRLTKLEDNSIIKFERIDELDKSIDVLSEQSQDFKSQSIIVNSSVVTLNNTLDKMNKTLDKLNETVIIVGQDVNHLKKDVEDLKREVKNK